MIAGRPSARRLAAASGLVVIGAVIAYGFWGFSYDDAFITYRYADRWAHGGGLTFNTGEHVLGTSAPGYALLLGILTRALAGGLAAPELGTLLSLGALLAMAWILCSSVAMTSKSPVATGAQALILGGLAMTAQWNIEMLGAETLLVTALIVGAADLAFRRGAQVGAGLLLAGAMAFRLDAGAAAGVFGFALWVRDKRFPYRFSAAGLFPLFVWLPALYARFGRVLPVTLAAKQAELGLASSYSLAQWSWLRQTMPAVACLLLLGLAAAGLVELVRSGAGREPVAIALGAYLVLMELIYRLLGVPFAPWYHVGLFNVLLFLAVRGAYAAASRALSLVQRSLTRSARAPALATVLASAILTPVWLPGVRYSADRWRTPPDSRTGMYAVVGAYLRRHAPPDASVAAVEIGALGYTSQRPILDLMGLVSPEAMAVRSQAGLATLLLARQPCFILDVPGFHTTVLQGLADDRIRRRYRPVTTFPAYPRIAQSPTLLELEPPNDRSCGGSSGSAQSTTGRDPS